MLKEGANEEAENLTGQRTVGRGSIAPSHHSCPACIGTGLRLQENGNGSGFPQFLLTTLLVRYPFLGRLGQVKRCCCAGSEQSQDK